MTGVTVTKPYFQVYLRSPSSMLPFQLYDKQAFVTLLSRLVEKKSTVIDINIGPKLNFKSESGRSELTTLTVTVFASLADCPWQPLKRPLPRYHCHFK
eukprot:g2489.t1